MNWQMIVGIFLFIGGIGNITNDIGAFFFGIILGGGLFYLGLRKKGYLKKKQTTQYHIDGYVLAYSYDDVKFYPPVDMINRAKKSSLSIGSEVNLVKEPNNPVDPNAVALYIGQDQIGYLLRNRLQDMANDYISRRWPVRASLVSLKKSNGEYHGYISLAFYNPVE